MSHPPTSFGATEDTDRECEFCTDEAARTCRDPVCRARHLGVPYGPYLSRAELRHVAAAALVDFWQRFENPDDDGPDTIDQLLAGNGDTLIEVILTALNDVGALPMSDPQPRRPDR